MSFLTEKLHHLKVMKKRTFHELCQELCCPNIVMKKKCMYGECDNCCTKSLPVQLSAERCTEQTFYQHWSSRLESRIDKNDKPLSVRVVVKDRVSCTIEKLICDTETLLTSFLKHVYNVEHQYEKMKEKRVRLDDNEVLF